MTIRSWLETRDPVPPPDLRRRIVELVEAAGVEGDRTYACLAAAEAALGRLVRDTDASRGGALDLLAIDALVTYAFEAASDDPESIELRATEAMARLSRVVAP